MTQRIAILGAKGGVGGTTVAWHLANTLAGQGRSVLLVDLDPAGSLGIHLRQGRKHAREEARFETGMADLLLYPGEKALEPYPWKESSLSILPRGPLSPSEWTSYQEALADPERLGKALDALQDHAAFDLILLDAPGGLHPGAEAAIRNAKLCFLCVQAQPLAGEAAKAALHWIDHIEKEMQDSGQDPATFLGLLSTMVKSKSRLSTTVSEEIRALDPAGLGIEIPYGAIYPAASRLGLSLQEIPTCEAPHKEAFERLATRVLVQVGKASASGEEEDFGPALWDRILQYCRDTAKADAAFVMDTQGLAIASAGPISAEEVENAGTRLMISFEHAGRIDREAGAESIVFQFEKKTLTGLLFRPSEDQSFTLGILSTEALSPQQRDSIVRVAEDLLQGHLTYPSPKVAT
ncbi:MAG TPA: ParA family protein [Planctomycetes bacterium]|nr:ParA family protein [Planctomycetota bacterium]